MEIGFKSSVFNSGCDMPDCKFFKESLHRVVPFCDNFMKRELGNGQAIKFWEHNWGYGCLKFEFHHLYKEAKDKGITVNLIYQTQNIEELFQDIGALMNDDSALQQLDKLKEILTIDRINTAMQDNVSWMLQSNKDFSVKSAYLGMKNMPAIGSHTHRIWKFRVAPRIKVFAWLVYYNKILTADNVAKRGWNLPSICFLCRRASETVYHLFSECMFTLELCKITERKVSAQVHDWKSLFGREEAQKWIITKRGGQRSKEMILITMFVAWRERCSRIFQDISKSLDNLVQEVEDIWRVHHG